MPATASSYSRPEIPTFQVSQAISFCNELLSSVELRVEGEVANYTVSRDKFVFFDLKDEKEDARIPCFMMAYQLSVPLEDGMRIVAQGKAGLYQRSGKFRLAPTRIEAVGEGSLKRAFELLKAKLETEGLFAPERKRVLPRYVERVGVISSKDAAGLGDFKLIAEQRLPGVEYTVVNVAVQGVDAEREICAAFDYLNGQPSLDVIVLIRGGGSLEDLHAFNSELVARAIARSKSPVLVGVGHERDITIADFVADVRAATPSNAAQILLPTKEEVAQDVRGMTAQGRLTVERTIARIRERVTQQAGRTGQACSHALLTYRNKLATLLRSIDDLSPQRTLERGYSITLEANGATAMVSTSTTGDKLTTIVADGTISSTVN